MDPTPDGFPAGLFAPLFLQFPFDLPPDTVFYLFVRGRLRGCAGMVGLPFEFRRDQSGTFQQVLQFLFFIFPFETFNVHHVTSSLGISRFNSSFARLWMTLAYSGRDVKQPADVLDFQPVIIVQDDETAVKRFQVLNVGAEKQIGLVPDDLPFDGCGHVGRAPYFSSNSSMPRQGLAARSLIRLKIRRVRHFFK